MEQSTKEMMGMLMGLIAMVLGMGIPILAIILEYRKRKAIFTMHHQERMAALEKGIEVPPLPEAFFAQDGRPRRPWSRHRSARFHLLLVSVGSAALIALYFNDRGPVSLYALIPIFWGLSGLIYGFTLGKNEAGAIETARTASAEDTNRRPA